MSNTQQSQYSKGSEWRRWDLHVHTRSSYDRKYSGDDAEQLLCDTLRKNEIAAVAITDHFKIDSERISKLREIAPEITFFPGVELRTNYGATNIHIILIFSEKADVVTLSNDFKVMMFDNKAKQNLLDTTIFWELHDIIDYAKSKNAIVTIHAGGKSNGVEEITNALPIDMATKEELVKDVDFFEVNSLKDIEDYHKHVFKFVGEKPTIICSDCHDPRNYSPNEFLWIKADPTFEGLLQCIHQPRERIFVGDIPPALDRERRSKRSNIASISTKRVDEPVNKEMRWFDFDIELNSGLVAIIGNKGSGKSALSDIIGHLCKATTMKHASFLDEKRFRKVSTNYAKDYEAGIVWGDSHPETRLLSDSDYGTGIEDAQYLPQKFIEVTCNEIDSVFQEAVDKVIFSYVDKTERGNAKNLNELVANKTSHISMLVKRILNELDALNTQISQLEERKTSQYRNGVIDSLQKLSETLERHKKICPTEVKKPEPKDDEYQRKIQQINDDIAVIELEITTTRSKISSITESVDGITRLMKRIDLLEADVAEVNRELVDLISKYELGTIDEISIKTPSAILENHANKLSEEKNRLLAILNSTSDTEFGADEDIGLLMRLEIANKNKSELVSSADSEEKLYQKYLTDYKAWEDEKKSIEGDPTSEGTLRYFQSELEFLADPINKEHSRLLDARSAKTRELFNAKQDIISIYSEIYSPVENEIIELLGDLEENIRFSAEIRVNNNLADSLLTFVSRTHSGIFKGRTESLTTMNQYIKETDFGEIDSVMEKFVERVANAVYEDIDISAKKVTDKKGFFNRLFGLEYIDVAFKLRVGDRDLEELSPGELGIVLLVFYLALSKNSDPIIIDQPEDNLDNQSVFSKLVPCICAAKKKRQVIIVTHNPNIAIACDAEQVIYCKIDKANNAIQYESGSIENTAIKKHVIDVLEGTMPAFDLRKSKYIDYSK